MEEPVIERVARLEQWQEAQNGTLERLERRIERLEALLWRLVLLAVGILSSVVVEIVLSVVRR